MPVDDVTTAPRVLARSLALAVVFGGVLAVVWWFGASAASADEAAPEPAGIAGTDAATAAPAQSPVSALIPPPQHDPAASAAAVMEPVTEAVNALVLPIVQAADPIVQPAIRAAGPVVQPVTDLLEPAVRDLAPAALVPLRAVDAPNNVGAVTLPPVPEVSTQVEVPEGPAPSVTPHSGHGSSTAPTGPRAVAPDNETTGVPSARWPSRPDLDRTAAPATPVSTASPSTAPGRDLPDKTHDAMTIAMALAHSAIPAAVAPAGSRVVGASENSGSRPSVTPD